MLAQSFVQTLDRGTWHRLTDEYAAALSALERGEPTARECVDRLYPQLRQILMSALTGAESDDCP